MPQTYFGSANLMKYCSGPPFELRMDNSDSNLGFAIVPVPSGVPFGHDFVVGYNLGVKC